MPVPHLLDEIIGCIFSHLSPGKLLEALRLENQDQRTLKTCCLVSRRFAFWARHGLYRKIDIVTPRQLTHYASLCRRYSDMAVHIKILHLTLTEEHWPQATATTKKAFHNLTFLFDFLSQDGSVLSCHLRLAKPWDRLDTTLQISILRFLLSHPLDTIELGGICPCFPMGAIPFPWIAKRFHLLNLNLELVEGGGKRYVSCPEWEKERKATALSSKNRPWKKELVDAVKSFVEQLHARKGMHPEKTRLESLWIPANTVPVFESHLNRPESGFCIHNLRELQFSNVHDGTIPDDVRLIEACKDTLGSLCLYNIQVRTATSSHLSLLTSTPLPRLHTLTIMTHMEATAECVKSVPWYLLHAKKNRQMRLKTLNLMFVDSTHYSDRLLSTEGFIGNAGLVEFLFKRFDFFKLENLVLDLLTPSPDASKLNLWFMLGSFAGPMEELIVELRMGQVFPTLVKEKRVTGSIGECDEAFMVADALSIFPEGSGQTRQQRNLQDVNRAFNAKEAIFRPMFDKFRREEGIE